MSFLVPQFLWALLALIPLALVYLIKVHPVRKKTSAWFLWDGIFQERRAASLLQKLRDWLSLLLMILAFIFLILGLAQPVLQKDKEIKQLVLIIDTSLSMNAKGHLEAAKKAARVWIRSLPAGGRAAIFSISGELLSETGFTDNRRELMRGLDGIELTDMPLNAPLLNPFVRDKAKQDQQRIILFSDGCFADAKALPKGIEWEKVGSAFDNVGITTFDVRRVPREDQPVGIFFRLFSGYSETTKVEVALSQGTSENLQRIFPVTLAPGLNDPIITTVPNGATGRWMLKLDPPDALARDNVAYAVVPEVHPIRVAVRAPKTLAFWQNCVEAFSEGTSGLQLVNDHPDLELFRGKVPSVSATRLAIFAPQGSSPFWKKISGEPTEASIRVLSAEHPLMRYANLDGRLVGGVQKIVPPDQAVVLAETDSGIPLIYKTTQNGRTAYVINFDPAQNDFFLRPLYPVLIWSLATELMGLEEVDSLSTRPGGVLNLPNPFVEGLAQTTNQPPFNFSNQQIGPLRKMGFYTVTSGTNRMTVACSGAPLAEMQLNNKDVVASGSVSRKMSFPLSEIFLVIALLILTLECVLYHRRKVG